MTGLVWKDLLIMRKALKSYLLILVLYAGMAYMGIFQFGFVVSFIQIVLMTLPLSAFAYDEQAKWDRYAMSLPLGRGAVVGARYLFVLVLSLLTFATGLVATIALGLLGLEDPMEMVFTLLVASAMGLLIQVVILPLSYKLGAERARPYLYAIVFIPVIAVVLLVRANVIDLSVLHALDDFSPSALLGYAALLPAAALACLFVSYLISCRIAAGKEY